MSVVFFLHTIQILILSPIKGSEPVYHLEPNRKSVPFKVMKRFTSFPCHTVTLDSGSENTNWKDMEEATHASVYYAHPYHSWERGTNENTNGLIREYFPKGTDFTHIPDEEIAKVEYILNTRPRKRLGWSTPLQVMSVALRG